jgi:hypothetical protein
MPVTHPPRLLAQESQRIHRAFKEAMAHQAAATAAGLGPGGSLKASSVLGGSTAGGCACSLYHVDTVLSQGASICPVRF